MQRRGPKLEAEQEHVAGSGLRTWAKIEFLSIPFILVPSLAINWELIKEFLKMSLTNISNEVAEKGVWKQKHIERGNLKMCNQVCDFCSICYCCCCSLLCRIAHWAIRKINQVARALKFNLNDRVEKLGKHQPSNEDWKIPKHFHCIVTSLQSALPFWAARWKENLASSLKSSSSSPTLDKS